MNTKELKQYLDMVVELEENIYLQNNLYIKIKQKMDTLGVKARFVEPVAMEKPVEPMRPSETIEEAEETTEETTKTLQTIGCLLILLVIGIAIDAKNSWYASLGFLLWFLSGLALIVNIIFFLPAAIIDDRLEMKKRENLARELYEKELAEYKAKMVRYEENKRKIAKYKGKITEDRKRIEKEMIYKKQLANELDKIDKIRKVEQNILTQVYAKNIIYPKYRNFVMVCSLYEYICSGRCDSLEGRDGAYNILELEIRMDRIITKLDKVIEQLDAIQGNQYMLYNAVKEVGWRTSQIMSSLSDMNMQLRDIEGQFTIQGEQLYQKIEKIQENSALSAYCAERTQKELHYMNQMNYYTARNEEFLESPPK